MKTTKIVIVGGGFAGLSARSIKLFGWTLDLFFGREVEQMITLRDVEAATQRLDLLRQRTKKQTDGRHEEAAGHRQQRNEFK